MYVQRAQNGMVIDVWLVLVGGLGSLLRDVFAPLATSLLEFSARE